MLFLKSRTVFAYECAPAEDSGIVVFHRNGVAAEVRRQIGPGSEAQTQNQLQLQTPG